MILAVDITDGRGLTNKACRELLPNIMLIGYNMNHSSGDPTKNCENILIKRTPKTMFKAFYGLKKLPRSSFNTPKTIIEVSIWYLYFHVIENTPNSPSSSSFTRLQSTQSGNHK